MPPELDEIIKPLFADLKKRKLNRDLFSFTFQRLLNAIETVFKSRDTELDSFIEQLKTNAAVFSAFKTHAQQRDLVELLVDDQGKPRSFSAFKKAATPTIKDYNVTYLRAEYNMAVRQARAAESWKRWEKQTDVYTNLEYMPSRAANPSKDHEAYYGIIRPFDDQFWNVMPPSRWGCQCGVRPTRVEPTTQKLTAKKSKPNGHISRDPGIAGNTGKTGQIFSADHPFIKGVPSDQKKKIKAALPKLIERAK